MKNTKPRKLSLKRHAITELTPRELRITGGGRIQYQDTSLVITATQPASNMYCEPETLP